MAKFVIKKEEKKEPFDEEKLKYSIRINAIEALLEEEEEKINRLVEEVSSQVIKEINQEEKEEIPTREIRDKILNKLKVVAPKVAEAWKKYEIIRKGKNII